MKNDLMKFVLRFRIAIYVVGIIAFVIAVSCKGCCETVTEDTKGFWPPDIIPHPCPPPEPPEEFDPDDPKNWS